MQKQFQKYLTFILILTLSITAIGSVSAAPSQQEIDCAETYTVQANDWLSKIAEKYYGDSLEYDTIVAATNAVAESESTYTSINNPNLIEIGWNLCIPSLTKEGKPIILEQADEAIEIMPTDTPTSPLPTETPIPTATDVPPTETASTEVLEPVILAEDSNVNLRSGPGTEYEIVGLLTSGNNLKIVGRNADSSWWQVLVVGTISSAPEGLAWVANSVVRANNVNDSIPVIEAPPSPVQPTPAPLPTSTEVPQQSSEGNTSGTPFQCIGGCVTPPDPSCPIKGNVNSKKEKIYHVPGGQYYERTDIKPEEGDRWFCTAEEARNAGFRASKR